MANETPSQDERLAEWLDAYEAAPDGASPPPFEENPSSELRERLYHGVAGLNLARMLRPSTASLAESSSEPSLPWASLGRFQLRKELGRGGCGIVYLAFDPLLNREVALKVPRAEVAVTPELRARFQHEAKAAASLDHPNLVSVFETGSAGPVCYIASAYCPGVNLAQWLKAEPDPPPVHVAASLVATLAGAIQHAHDRGVLHRDLKPSNVLLSRKASAPADSSSQAARTDFLHYDARITDFGLAKFLLEGTRPGQTFSGAIVGTPNYMAPEQAAGRVRDVGTAADIYALGAILYELLTGRPPFQGESDLDTLHRAQTEAPLSPRRLRPGLPRDIETICLKCLEKQGSRRYASARLLADDLERFLAGRPIHSRPLGAAGRIVRWGRLNPALAAASLVAAIALGLSVALSIGYTYARVEALSADRLRGEHTQTKADLARSRDQHREAAVASARLALDRGTALCQQGDTSHGFLWLARSLALTPTEEPELEHSIRASLAGWRRQLQPLRQVISHAASVERMVLSPDGRTGASGSLDGSVFLWEAATGRLLHALPKYPHDVEALAFTPDGEQLLTSSDRTCHFWRVSTGEPSGDPITYPTNIYHAAFTSDGRTFAVGGMNGYGRITRMDTREPLGLPLEHATKLQCVLAFSTDGRQLVTACDDTGAIRRDAQTGKRLGTAGRFEGLFMGLLVCNDGRSLLLADGSGVARRWELSTGEPLGPPMAHPGAVTCMAVSPDGSLIATGCNDGAARLWRGDTGAAQGQPLRHMMPVSSVAFSPDGRLLAIASQDGTARVWDVATGRAAGPPLSHRDQVVRLAFAQGGTTLVTASLDGTVRFWDVAARPLSLALTHQGPVEAVAFRADGKIVATGSSDQTVRLWDAETGRPSGEPLHHPGPVYALAFSPDGMTLGVGGRGGARLWQPGTGRTFDQPLVIYEGVFCVAFSPDGRFFATGGGDFKARRWQADTGEPVEPVVQHRHAVRSLAFSPDGKWLASADRGGVVQISDAATGQVQHSIRGHRDAVCSLAFSRDSLRLVTASHDGSAQWWGVVTGQPIGDPLPHEGRVLALTLDRAEVRLATASVDSRARLWDVRTGRLLGSPLPHAGAVTGVAFHPDGRLLATACADGTVREWDTESGKPFGMPLPHDGPVERVMFSPDGRAILTAGREPAARLWRLPAAVTGEPGRIAAWAEVLTGQELDAEGRVGVLDSHMWERRRHSVEERGGSP